MSTHTPDAIQRHAIISSVLIDQLSSPHAILRAGASALTPAFEAPLRVNRPMVSCFAAARGVRQLDWEELRVFRSDRKL
ncbi:MAG TPA: hypothetical protein VFB88_20285 [Xanthobacteraceae bacterium]|nr:hypothetical protein [Xanthobacteraceae bacterium]